MKSNIRLIAHRGNIFGPNKARENSPSYIDEAIAAGFDVEIDVTIQDNKLYLGHDTPDHLVTIDWLYHRKDKLYIHCKDFAALRFFAVDKYSDFFHFFTHSDDNYTLTSKGIIWAHPSAAEIKDTIYVIQGQLDINFLENFVISNQPLGICSDYVTRIRGLLGEGES